jgi:hypothetical protein
MPPLCFNFYKLDYKSDIKFEIEYLKINSKSIENKKKFILNNSMPLKRTIW